MHRRILALILILAISVSFAGCAKKKNETVTPTPTGQAQADITPDLSQPDRSKNSAVALELVNYFDSQHKIDQNLMAEATKKYKFEEPLVVVNPYGNSPLTAVAIFSTDSIKGGSITVKGKAKEDDIKGSFPESRDHIVPIYGLYPAATTEVVLTLDDGRSTTLSVSTDAIEMDTEGISVQMKNSDAYDYSKLTFIMGLNGYFYAVDSKGDVRWFMKKNGTLGIKILKNGHLIMPSNYTIEPLYYQSGIIEMDLMGKVYREYAIPGGMHHDIFEMPNGNLLVAANRPNLETLEDYVVELDRETGQIVWELDMKELIDPKEGGSLNRSDVDWLHNNGVWYDEAKDLVLLSSRHIDAIVAVDKTNKKLKWILGDPEGWSEEYKKYFFTPVGDKFEWQYAQHQVTILSNGDIMCFDNGAGRTKVTKPEKEVSGDDVFSRAVVYRIDTDKMTIRQIWEYGRELGPEVYSEWVSGAIELDSDPKNIWITFGSNLYNPEKGDYDYGPADMFTEGLVHSTKVVQVKNDKLVYRLTLPHLTYRTLKGTPYKDISAYDPVAYGFYLGNMGVSQSSTAQVDLSDAELRSDIELALDPIKLTVKASFSAESSDELPDCQLVLNMPDGNNLIYKLTATASENENGQTIATVDEWISTSGLEGKEYYIYLILGGKTYFTGKKLDLK